MVGSWAKSSCNGLGINKELTNKTKWKGKQLEFDKMCNRDNWRALGINRKKKIGGSTDQQLAGENVQIETLENERKHLWSGIEINIKSFLVWEKAEGKLKVFKSMRLSLFCGRKVVNLCRKCTAHICRKASFHMKDARLMAGYNFLVIIIIIFILSLAIL